MATGGNESASDEIVNIKCSVCAEKEITREAQRYCMECKDYYCIPCTDMHKLFPAMRRHNLLDKADFSSAIQVKLPCFPTEVCSVHKGRLLEMYCRNHDEVVCATCVALNHRACQDIHSIPDEIENLYTELEFDDTNRKLDASKKILKDVTTTTGNLLSELKHHKKAAIDSVLNFRRMIEAELGKLETESIKKIETDCGQIEETLQIKVKNVEKCTADIDKSANKLKNSAGNKAQEFVCVKAAEKHICLANKEEESLQVMQKADVQIKFCFNPAIETALKKFKTFGEVYRRGNVYKPRTTIYTVKDHKEINIKLPHENNPSSYGSCFVGDGLLLLTDKNNKNLKR